MKDGRWQWGTSANKYRGLLPRTNADKRNSVELLLQDPEWQLLSDRAIAEHCGVSAPLVGKIRAELALLGTVNISTERIDKSGRKIQTVNIGTKPKKKLLLTETAAELAPGVPQEQLTNESKEAIPQRGQRFAIAPLGESIVSTNGLVTQTQQEMLQTKMEAVMAIVQSEVEMLSQKVGAKTLAQMSLDLCTLEEIKEIHAQISLTLDAPDEEA